MKVNKAVTSTRLMYPVTVIDVGEKKEYDYALKCKRCKNEFIVYRFGYYYRDVCFCPYCGAPKKETEDEL